LEKPEMEYGYLQKEYVFMTERIFDAVCDRGSLYELSISHLAMGSIDLHATHVFPFNVFSIEENAVPECSIENLDGDEFRRYDRPALAMLVPPGLRIRRNIDPRLRFIAVHFHVGFGAGPDFFAGQRRWWSWEDPALLEEMRAVTRQTDTGRMICALKAVLWRLIGERLPVTDIGREQALAHYGKIFRWVAEHSDEHLTVAEMAAHHGCRPDVFARNFRRDTGMTPRDFLCDTRIRRVAAALTGGGESIKELAERFGFCSPFQLSEFFRKRTGLSPSEYRKKFGAPPSGRP